MTTLKTFVILLALCAVTLGLTAQREGTKTIWEYKFVYECNEKKANALGQEGWELAAIQSPGPPVTNNVATYVFKRQK